MKAFILDGPMAGRVTSLTKQEEAMCEWEASYCWDGLKQHKMTYFTVMTSEVQGYCIMTMHRDATERGLINHVLNCMTEEGRGQDEIDATELRLDSGVFTAAALETMRTMADINLWLMRMQQESNLKEKPH